MNYNLLLIHTLRAMIQPTYVQKIKVLLTLKPKTFLLFSGGKLTIMGNQVIRSILKTNIIL